MRVVLLLIQLLFLLPRLGAIPPGFVEEIVADVEAPTDIDFVPRWGGGHYLIVVSKYGKVYLIEEDPRGQRFFTNEILNLESETCNEQGMGLLSVLVHPKFLYNRFIYLFYS